MDFDAKRTFEAKPAERKQIPALICLWGHSFSGKTMSALRLARGLVGKEGQIAVIDTENRRAEYYDDQFHGDQGPWLHIDLQPPFNPEAYIAAHKAAIEAGADVVIIDSASHVWEGEGGVIDQAESARTSGGQIMHGLGKWRVPKMAYKRMTNAFFRTPVHTIFCLRAKNKNVQKGQGKSAEIINIGDVPVCDPNNALVYESLISCYMQHGSLGTFESAVDPCTPIRVKAPEALKDAIKPGEFITEKCGEKIAAWLSRGKKRDEKADELAVQAREEATKGYAHMVQWWSSIGPEKQHALQSIQAELRHIAEQADAETAGTPPSDEIPFDDDRTDPLADEAA